MQHLEVAIGHEAQAVAVRTEGLGHGGHEGHGAAEPPHPEVLGHLPMRVLLPLQALSAISDLSEPSLQVQRLADVPDVARVSAHSILRLSPPLYPPCAGASEVFRAKWDVSLLPYCT